jgi:hypothetical protein
MLDASVQRRPGEEEREEVSPDETDRLDTRLVRGAAKAGPSASGKQAQSAGAHRAKTPTQPPRRSAAK